jgi:hypothetical protein
MAKMFYTLDEAKAALGKNEEEIKQLSREGRLREFRDGPRLMFKADQVDALKNEISSSGPMDHVDLGQSDSGMAIGLVDSSGGSRAGLAGSVSGSAAGLTLEDTEPGSRSGSGLAIKEDTALSADLGLAGSIGGMPSPSRLAGSTPGATGGGSALSGSQAGRSGIDVFQSDEVERVDPSAQTAVSSGVVEQLNTESIGSGSGLLDLTRESDDTSLGAELLDEIAPSGSGSGTNLTRKSTDTASVGSMAGSMAGSVGGSIGGSLSGSLSGTRSVAGANAQGRGGAGPAPIVYVEKPDPMAAAFGAAALGATIFVIFGAFALVTGLLDTEPSVMKQISQFGFVILAGAGVAVSLVFFAVGFVLGKAGAR